MTHGLQPIAWAIAEAWWRKNNRQAAGVTLEADSATDYADRFWQNWEAEARAAVRAAEACLCRSMKTSALEAA